MTFPPHRSSNTTRQSPPRPRTDKEDQLRFDFTVYSVRFFKIFLLRKKENVLS